MLSISGLGVVRAKVCVIFHRLAQALRAVPKPPLSFRYAVHRILRQLDLR